MFVRVFKVRFSDQTACGKEEEEEEDDDDDGDINRIIFSSHCFY